MPLAEFLPVLPVILGSAVVGAGVMFGGSKIYAAMPSSKQKRIANNKAKNEEEWKQYAQSLLSHADQLKHSSASSYLGRPAADHTSVVLRTSLAFRRGKTEEDKAKFDQRFSKTSYYNTQLHNDIREQLDSIYRNYLPLLTSYQLVFYERQFQEEVRKSLQYVLLNWGLVITDLILKVDNVANSRLPYLENANMKKTPFKNILPILKEPQIPDQMESWKQKNLISDKSQHNESSSPNPASATLVSTLDARLDALEDAWLEYELNPALLLDYPLMVDASCEETADFLFAIKKVRTLHNLEVKDSAVIAELETALDAAEKAFIKAESNAKKQRHAYLTREQRAQIRNARPFVALVKDEEASPQERANAYRKANDFLEGIIALPDKAILGLLEQ